MRLLLQAFGTWQNLLSRYGQVQLCPNTVSEAVEDAALVLPDLASGEAAWSVFDTLEEESGMCISYSDSISTLHRSKPNTHSRSCILIAICVCRNSEQLRRAVQ